MLELKRYLLKTAAAASALLLAATPVLAQEIAPAPATGEIQPETNIVPVPSTPTPAPKPVETADVDPALWVVKDSDTTIYLFGTVHVLRPGLSWFDDGIKAAFDESGELVTEILLPGDPAEMQRLYSTLAVDRSGTNLRDKLNDKDRAAYESAMIGIDLPVQTFDQFDPWFAAISLGNLSLVKSGYDLASGAEMTLSAAAQKAGKKRGGLETIESQLTIFDMLPAEKQIEYLNATVQGIDEADNTVDSLVSEWGDANTAKLADLMNAGLDDPMLYDMLLTRRNAAWSHWIDNRLKQPGTVFVAVGAGHLAGRGSVQEQLEKLGLHAERVNY